MKNTAFQAINHSCNPSLWNTSDDFAKNSVLFCPPGRSRIQDRRLYRPQIKILRQERVRQCETFWLRLCKWQRVHGEWQVFLKRLKWHFKGFHLPPTEINHSTHTLRNWAHRSGLGQLRWWRDRFCLTFLWGGSPLALSLSPGFYLCVSLSVYTQSDLVRLSDWKGFDWDQPSLNDWKRLVSLWHDKLWITYLTLTTKY